MVQKNVLLAEDDPGHVALFRRAVSQSGVPCRLSIVGDGTEVIDYLFGLGKYKDPSLAPMPELLLLDLSMPKMSGLHVLQVMRRVRSEERMHLPPVVVLAASELDEDVAAAYRYGARSYIRKPQNFEDFSAAVHEALHYWLGLNRALRPARADFRFAHEGQ